MTIYIHRKKDSYINGYTVSTGIVNTETDYTEKAVAWFKTISDAIDYAKYLIINQPFGMYDEIRFGGDRN